MWRNRNLLTQHLNASIDFGSGIVPFQYRNDRPEMLFEASWIFVGAQPLNQDACSHQVKLEAIYLWFIVFGFLQIFSNETFNFLKCLAFFKSARWNDNFLNLYTIILPLINS